MKSKASHADFIAKVRAEKNLDKKTPEKKTKDRLPDHLYWIWDAFTTLSRSRLVNEVGPQPISVADIAAYFTFAQPPTAMDRVDFLHLIEEMDIMYCKEIYRRIEEEQRKAAKKSGKRNRKPSTPRR